MIAAADEYWYLYRFGCRQFAHTPHFTGSINLPAPEAGDFVE